MPKMLTKLRIREVSSVDRGAGDGVKIMLMKRDDDEPLYWEKREFSRERRDRDAKSGAAEKDGSFPIENKSDLHNAMRAIGRSKNPSKTRDHIRARARALGLSGELSDSFKREEPMSKIGKLFSSIFGGAGNNEAVIDKSLEGLAESVTSILASTGDDVAKGEALTETFEQFGEHLKSTMTAPAVDNTKGSDMDIKVLAKSLGLAESATEADVTAAIAQTLKAATEASTSVKKLQKELELAKADLTADELAYINKESEYDEEEDHDDEPSDKSGKTNEAKGEPKRVKSVKAFLAASHTERAKIMKSAEPPLPAHVQKMMDEFAVIKKQNDELMSKLALADFTKRSVDVGLGEGKADTIRKAYSGDRAAVDELLTIIKGAHAAASVGEVFKEFGTVQGGNTPDDPYVALTMKADELRKGNPNLSQAAAFTKVYEDPANADLVRKERAKNRPAAA